MLRPEFVNNFLPANLDSPPTFQGYVYDAFGRGLFSAQNKGLNGLPTGVVRPAQAGKSKVSVGYFPHITLAQAFIGMENGYFAAQFGSKVENGPYFFTGGRLGRGKPGKIKRSFRRRKE